MSNFLWLLWLMVYSRQLQNIKDVLAFQITIEYSNLAIFVKSSQVTSFRAINNSLSESCLLTLLNQSCLCEFITTNLFQVTRECSELAAFVKSKSNHPPLDQRTQLFISIPSLHSLESNSRDGQHMFGFGEVFMYC